MTVVRTYFYIVGSKDWITVNNALIKMQKE